MTDEPSVASDAAFRHALPVLLTVIGFAGFGEMVNAAAAAFYAEEFGLDDAGVARLLAWISVGVAGTVVLTRLMDRFGRRRMVVGCTVVFATAAAASALAPGPWFLLAAQIPLGACLGAIMAAGSVCIAEELPTEQRAPGQALKGIVIQLGSGAALIGVALAQGLGGSWRLAWAFAAMSILTVPLLLRALPETQRFSRADDQGETRSARISELVTPRYRSRTVFIVGTSYFTNVASFATMTWLLYHPETALGLSPGVVTAIVIAGGAVGLAGFPLGARLSNRWGRRSTAAAFGAGFVGANIGYYLIPADTPHLVVALGCTFGVASICFGAAGVALSSAQTELFPTRLRATLGGVVLVTGGAAAVSAQFAIAFLVDLTGSLVTAITVVASLGFPGFGLFLLLPETAGLSLEESALETDVGAGSAVEPSPDPRN